MAQLNKITVQHDYDFTDDSTYYIAFTGVKYDTLNAITATRWQLRTWKTLNGAVKSMTKHHGNMNLVIVDDKPQKIDVTVKAYTIEGQLIYQKDNILTSMHQLEIKEDTGLYIINVSSQDKQSGFKIVKE